MSGRPTRERLIECIRERGSCTISDLQQQTGLSRSALRQHLTHLTRARLVTSAFEQRSTGRPPRLYRLRARSDPARPERYPVFLQGVLTAMRAWGREPVEALFPQLATRLASAHSDIRRSADPAARLDAARRLFFGSDAGEVEPTETGFKFSISTCPLGPTSMEFCDLCRVTRMVLGALTGQEVEQSEWIIRGDPRCTFEVQTE
jgi:predicted ArsR family transcriptional regulator